MTIRITHTTQHTGIRHLSSRDYLLSGSFRECTEILQRMAGFVLSRSEMRCRFQHTSDPEIPLSLKPFGDARYGIGNSLKWRCSRRTKVKPSHAIAIHLFSGVSLPNTLGFWTGSPSSDILLPKWGFAFTLYNAMIMMHIEFEFFCSYEPQKLFWAPLPL